MKQKSGIVFLFMICCMSAGYYYNTITLLPRGIHEWAQADRYSLAVMFYNHGFNFFRPQTLNSSAIDNVVGVEFPYQSYLAALIAIPFGEQSLPLIFRLITLITVITGLYFLFRLTKLFTASFFIALLPPLLLFCSPVFVYYSGNFQPDTNAVAFGLIAFYFHFLFNRTGHKKHLFLSLLFITLAVLIKSSMVAYWIGMALHHVFIYIRKRKQIDFKYYLKILAVQFISFVIIVLFFLHNSYLNNTYHSWIFNYTLWLANTNASINHADELKNILFNNMLNPNRWLFEYFLPIHYLIMIAAGFFFFKSVFKKYFEGGEILWLILFSVPFMIGIFLLFGNQFVDHDYYFIAIFYPLFCLVFVWFCIGLNTVFKNVQLKFGGILICATLVCTYYFAQSQQIARTGNAYKGFEKYYHFTWMIDGKKILDNNHIPANTKILVMGEEAPNLALVYFGREGQVISWYDTPKKIIQLMHEGNLDYLLMQKEKYNSLLADQPDYFKQFLLAVSAPQFVLFATKQ